MTEDRCAWCGKTYEEHEDRRDMYEPVPRVPCLLLKIGFRPKPKTEEKAE